MAKNTKHFYVAKGENDEHPWLYYGEEPPIIANSGRSNEMMSDCNLIGSFANNPIANSIKNNEIIKIYIRKETSKKIKDEI